MYNLPITGATGTYFNPSDVWTMYVTLHYLHPWGPEIICVRHTFLCMDLSVFFHTQLAKFTNTTHAWKGKYKTKILNIRIVFI